MLDKWTLTIPQLTGEEIRKAYIYIPDGYPEDVRFPVLYMFDGQNLFEDSEATFGKSWGISDYLEKNNVPLIVTGVECNHHREDEQGGGRLSEYSPFDFDDPYWGSITARGQITMDWLVNEYKPFIDEHFPTLPEREYTFIGGSSMGGLMTIYALMEYNDVFSRGAALSPAVGFSPKECWEMIEKAEIGPTVLYMDAGENELKRQGVNIFAQGTGLLVRKGVLVTSRIVPDGNHNEASWEKQLPFFINTLFYDLQGR